MANGRGAGAANMAHEWAHQTRAGHKISSCRVFFDGKIIYSYGRHFPMGVRLDANNVLITTATYSSTTAGHLSTVRSAVSHMNRIYAYHLPDYDYDDKFPQSIHSKNIEHWIKQVKNKLDDVTKAVQHRKKDRLMGELPHIQDEARKYIEHFKLKLDRVQRQQLFTVDLPGYIAGLKRAEVAAKRKAAARIRDGKKLFPEWLLRWRAFDSDRLQELSHTQRSNIEAYKTLTFSSSYVWLRVGDDGIVYTNKGIRIPVDVAHRYYRKYLAVVANGGCSETCNYKMLEYEVKEMNAEHLLVGCHDIARSEIDYIAEKLGWATDVDRFIKQANDNMNGKQRLV